jgi:hypothetical protein
VAALTAGAAVADQQTTVTAATAVARNATVGIRRHARATGTAVAE